MWYKVDRVENLRDIKGLIEIPDYSLFLFVGVVLFSILFLYYAYKFLKSRKKRVLSKEEIARRELKNLDLNDSKSSAYKFSKYARYLDSKIDTSFLQKYKYKKNVSSFEKADRKKIEKFLENV